MLKLFVLASGYCGGCRWALDIFGALVIRPGKGRASGRLERNGTMNDSGWPWEEYCHRIKRVVVKKGVQACSDMDYIFSFMRYCRTFDVGTLDMGPAESLRCAFWGCHKLNDLVPLSKWQLRNVRTMEGMFKDCISIKSLQGLEAWAMPSLLEAEEMFSGCRNLMDADAVKTWKADRLEDMTGIFYDTKIGSENDPFDSSGIDLSYPDGEVMTGWTVCTGIRYKIPFLAKIIIPKWTKRQLRHRWRIYPQGQAEGVRVTAFYDLNGNKIEDIKKARAVYGPELFDLGYVLEIGENVTTNWSPKEDRFLKPETLSSGIPFYLSEVEAQSIADMAWEFTLQRKRKEYTDWKEKAVKTGGKL